MRNHRRRTETARLARERREREDSAPRLADLCPTLQELRFEIAEVRAGDQNGADHIRRIVVEHAPALFEMPCIDRSCKDGGHDLTSEVLEALRAHQKRFEGQHACRGSLGAGSCKRVMRYVAYASYRR